MHHLVTHFGYWVDPAVQFGLNEVSWDEVRWGGMRSVVWTLLHVCVYRRPRHLYRSAWACWASSCLSTRFASSALSCSSAGFRVDSCLTCSPSVSGSYCHVTEQADYFILSALCCDPLVWMYVCKVKLTEYSTLQECLTTAGTHMPHVITQCYCQQAEVTFPPLSRPVFSWSSI